jgi:hypothetical protein
MDKNKKGFTARKAEQVVETAKKITDWERVSEYARWIKDGAKVALGGPWKHKWKDRARWMNPPKMEGRNREAIWAGIMYRRGLSEADLNRMHQQRAILVYGLLAVLGMCVGSGIVGVINGDFGRMMAAVGAVCLVSAGAFTNSFRAWQIRSRDINLHPLDFAKEPLAWIPPFSAK